MAKKKTRHEKIQELVQGKKIPLLTLDNKWHQLFPDEFKSSAIKKAEKELNLLIQRQGQMSNDIKELKKLKAALMKEIVENMEGAANNDSALQKKQAKNQKYILEINEKTENYSMELKEIPNKIQKANENLMMLCMEQLYSNLKNNDERITELTDWIKDVREKLTQSMIEREELQEYNASMYGYMHDLLGPEIVNIFDVKYKTFESDDMQKKGAFVSGVSSKSK